MSNKNKLISVIIITMLALVLMIFIGPCDGFSHGYFGEEIDIDQIATDDIGYAIDLAYGNHTISFMPVKNNMTGVEIFLVNHPEGNTGTLELSFTDKNRRILDVVEVDLAKVKEASWYKVTTNADLKKGRTYSLTFSVNSECQNIPWLLTVSDDYLPEETIDGNILLCYAYARSTFSFENKTLIILFLFAIWLFLISLFLSNKKKVWIRNISCVIFMTSMLSWNYIFNSIDNQNTSFSTFQSDSETLVTGFIYADRDGEYFRTNTENGYGLGRYYDLKGILSSYGLSYISDDNWYNGYSRYNCSVVVNSNPYSREVAVAGNFMRFINGEIYQITSVEDDGSNIIIYLNSSNVLSYAKYGSLDDVVFLDVNVNELHKSLIYAYTSQYGLQGKVFKRLSYLAQDISKLNLLCALATATVFAFIVLLLALKYNFLMALCFFITFWLSPWIINFARNLYWVEFTWFIPMAIGLFCAWKIDIRKYRIISYGAAFIAITIKCLCGYEYLTTVMMGMISFLLVDFICKFLNGDRDRAKLILKTIIVIGCTALAGFIVAICIHAQLKGGGNIIEGVKNIIEQDVLRRTYGADINSRNPADGGEAYSIFASTWEVICLYFHFYTEVITGIDGNLFALLCIAPLLIFGYEFKTKSINLELLVMYIVFFLTSISWFVLAKSHSYVHTHMNYVLWYFGFVQICFYIILNKIANSIPTNNSIRREIHNESI